MLIRTASLIAVALTLLACPTKAPAQTDNQPIPTSVLHRAKIANKIKTITIDKVNFDKADITLVLDFLTKKCKELDPDKEGINFVLKLPDPATATEANPATPATPKPRIHREFSISLDNISVADILFELCSQTNLQYTIEDYAIVLHPIK